MKGADTSTAIITGASHGFGHALASELARADWNLVIDARAHSELSTAAAAIEDLGAGQVMAITGDVTDPGHAVRLVETAAAMGGLTLLVNNASMLGPSPQPRLADYPLPVLEDVLAANLVAPLRLIQLSLPHLRRVRGTVVNITSDAGVEPYAGWGGYGSSKAGLEQLSSVLAAEEPSIHVYWFDPGDMRTRMHQEAFPGEDISDRPLPETRVPALLHLLEGGYPSGRYLADRLLSETVRA
jgi:NAD(P)-dependent dehydrogenase (short-subunit alcohol dehydrogenase family)